MESPSRASGRIVWQEEMVREVPPPPEDVGSRALSSVTAGELGVRPSLEGNGCLGCSYIEAKDFGGSISGAGISRWTHCLLFPRAR